MVLFSQCEEAFLLKSVQNVIDIWARGLGQARMNFAVKKGQAELQLFYQLGHPDALHLVPRLLSNSLSILPTIFLPPCHVSPPKFRKSENRKLNDNRLTRLGELLIKPCYSHDNIFSCMQTCCDQPRFCPNLVNPHHHLRLAESALDGPTTTTPPTTSTNSRQTVTSSNESTPTSSQAVTSLSKSTFSQAVTSPGISIPSMNTTTQAVTSHNMSETTSSQVMFRVSNMNSYPQAGTSLNLSTTTQTTATQAVATPVMSTIPPVENYTTHTMTPQHSDCPGCYRDFAFPCYACLCLVCGLLFHPECYNDH